MAIGFGIASRNWWRAQLKGGLFPSFSLNFDTIGTDFTFTRNSFATRVNEFGLIETVTNLSSNLVQNGNFDELGTEQVSNGNFALGSELVTNGNFENGTTDWQNPTYSGSNSATLSIDNNALKVEKNANLDWRTSFVNQTPLTFTSGKTYKITYSLKDGNTSGADVYIRTNFDRSASTVSIKALTNDWVEHTDYYVADSSANDISFGVLAWQNVGDGQYYFIDNVSVKEVTDWDLDSSWSVSDEKATYDASLNGQEIRQLMSSIAVGKTVKIQFDILDVEATKDAYFKLDCSGTPESIFPYTKFSEGTYTYYHTITSGFDRLNFTALNSSTGGAFSITNVSLKQVDPNDDWILDPNWSIADGKATYDGLVNIKFIKQNGVLPNNSIGKEYNISFEILDSAFTIGLTSGSGFFKDENAVNIKSEFAIGVHSVKAFSQNTATDFRIYGYTDSGNGGSIDNVSVQEVITDDIPRIDFTGSTFDVPVLGEELVTNGSFDTDANWTKQSGWSIANGVATFDINNYVGGNANIYQNCMVSGKEYVLTYDVVDYVQGYVRNVSRNGAIPRTANGTYTEKFIANNGNLFLKADSATNTILSIDNVSVKEVIGYTTEDKGAFLLEPISTNLITYSEDFKLNPAYGLSSTQVDSETEISPSESNNAYEVSVLTNNTNSVFDLGRVSTPSTTSVYTYSVYLKGKNNGDEVKLYGQRGTTFTEDVVLTTEWKRYDVTFTQDSSDKDLLILCGDYGLTQPAQSFYIWGAQVEELSYATSYIPTNGTTVTRAQESCIDATPTINSEEGVLYAEISALTDVNNNNEFISLNSLSYTQDSIYIQLRNSSNQIAAWAYSNGANEVAEAITLSDITTFNKIAIKWKLNDFNVFVNGTSVFADTSYNAPLIDSLETLNFSRSGGLGSFIGNTKDLKIYDKALTDDELINLTTI